MIISERIHFLLMVSIHARTLMQTHLQKYVLRSSFVKIIAKSLAITTGIK